MKYDYTTLKQEILTHYECSQEEAEAKFAVDMRFTDKIYYEKMQSQRLWTQDEIMRACDVLCIDHEEIVRCFFTPVKSVTIKDMIICKFGSLDSFAKDIGWSHNKAMHIANGEQEPTARDIEAIADKLEIEDPDDFRCLFFSI